MRKLLQRKWLSTTLIAAGMALTAIIAAQLLLRDLSLFLSFDPQFSAIFAQIRDAKMKTPFVLLWLPAFLYCVSTGSVHRKIWRIAAVLGGVLLWLLLLVGAVYLTTVNDILFGDVLVSLIDIFQKGGLDGL